MYFFKEEIGLVSGGGMNAPKVVCASDIAVIAGIFEIVIEVFVDPRGPFGGFYDNEAQRTTFYHGMLKLVPFDVSLVMGYVYSMDFKSIRILRVSIQGAPTKAGRADKKVIEHPDIQDHHTESSKKPRQFVMRRLQKRTFSLLANRVFSVGLGFGSCHKIKKEYRPSRAAGLHSLNYSGVYLVCSSWSVLVVWSQTSDGPQY